jgi:D-glycero-alpha-D-manno-heptose 1-phosphate guanylyltransferase
MSGLLRSATFGLKMKFPKTAVILAGGLGTRLRSLVSDRPKPMADVNGRPFLDYLISYWHENGIERFILSVGYLATNIKTHFGNRFDRAQIEYVEEEVPLGTGGALKRCLSSVKNVEKNLLILNGDTWFSVDSGKLISDFNGNASPVCMCIREVALNDRYGTVNIDHGGKVVGFHPPNNAKANVNGGVYLFDVNKVSRLISSLPSRFSLENDFLPTLVKRNELSSSVQAGEFFDIGVPSEYLKAKEFFKDSF